MGWPPCGRLGGDHRIWQRSGCRCEFFSSFRWPILALCAQSAGCCKREVYFSSAASGLAAGDPGLRMNARSSMENGEPPEQGVTEARVAALEATLGAIQVSLAALAKQPGAGQETAGRKPALRRSKRDRAASQPDMHVSFPGLQPAITQAALASGLSSAQLAEAEADGKIGKDPHPPAIGTSCPSQRTTRRRTMAAKTALVPAQPMVESQRPLSS